MVVDMAILPQQPKCRKGVDKAIVFTTVSAGNAYKEANGRYSNDPRVIYSSHPGYPYTWWKCLKSLDGKRGIDVMEDGLRSIFTV